MDKDEIKLILAAYRPEDAGDPIFAEALRAVAADPELAAWFEDMQRFDAVISRKLQDLPMPEDVKYRILREPQTASLFPVRNRSRARTLIASIAALPLAALVVLGLIAWHLAALGPSTMGQLELHAITYSKQMPALQFVCFNPSAVAQWINQQPEAQKVNLKLPPPPASMSMQMIGSSMVNWNGHPVVMICLQDGKHMAMLYVLKAGDVTGLQENVTETMQKADWVVRATKADGQVRLLAARGTPDDLDFPMPF